MQGVIPNLVNMEKIGDDRKCVGGRCCLPFTYGVKVVKRPVPVLKKNVIKTQIMLVVYFSLLLT